MIASEVIARSSIVDVWTALGGGPLRHGRGRAFWRHGDGLNVAVDASKGCWFDHASGTGGGMLDLVQLAKGCNRLEAMQFVANLSGVALPDDSSEDRTRRRHDFRRAMTTGRALVDLRNRCVQALGDYERGYLRLHGEYIREILSGQYDGEALARRMDEAEECERRYLAAEVGRDIITTASWEAIAQSARRMGVIS